LVDGKAVAQSFYSCLTQLHHQSISFFKTTPRHQTQPNPTQPERRNIIHFQRNEQMQIQQSRPGPALRATGVQALVWSRRRPRFEIRLGKLGDHIEPLHPPPPQDPWPIVGPSVAPEIPEIQISSVPNFTSQHLHRVRGALCRRGFPQSSSPRLLVHVKG
jgi:hypothetical protein